ncbi:MAG: hypothetical protein K1W24_13740 [Lachnospiraceae bacterium]
MFVWNKKMYMDRKVRKKPARYKKLACRKKSLKQCFCITFPANGVNIMDIYSSKEPWFKYRAAAGIEIIGMASCREAALQLVAEMAQDIYKKYGDISPGLVREFFA